MSLISGISTGLLSGIATGLIYGGELSPPNQSNLRIWLTPHSAAHRTLDTTAGRTSISSLVNRGTLGGTVAQSTKGNQPTLTTSVLNGYDVCNHDTVSRYMFGDQNTSGDVYCAMVINIASYNDDFGRVFSFTQGSNTDFNSTSRMVCLYRENVSSTVRSFQNSAGLGTPYSIATGTYRLVELLFDDSGNAITHWLNGSQTLNTAWTNTISCDTLLLGADDRATANSLNYLWPELCVYSGVPSSAQVTALRNYFNAKYNLGF